LMLRYGSFGIVLCLSLAACSAEQRAQMEADKLDSFDLTTEQRAIAEERLLAYHDRTDGGLAVTLAEMCFAGGLGLDVDCAALGSSAAAALFNEELGAALREWT